MVHLQDICSSGFSGLKETNIYVYLFILKIIKQVDVYSFGIVMWELLTGEEPYASMQFGAIIRKGTFYMMLVAW